MCVLYVGYDSEYSASEVTDYLSGEGFMEYCPLCVSLSM